MAQKTIHEVYADFKAQQGGVFILLHIGDFYETYDQDAEDAARILGITLTKRSDGTRLAGFPYHALDCYLPKIIRAGKRVCIVDKDVLDNALKNNQNENQNNQNENNNMETKNNIATENTNEVKNTISILNRGEARYYYNPDAKALVQIEIVNTFIDFDNCECRQYENSTGKDVQLTDEYRYYKDRADFENDRPISNPFVETDKQDLLDRMTDITNVKREDETDRAYILIFDGKPTRWYLDENIHTMWKTLTKQDGYEFDYDGLTIPKSYSDALTLSLFNDYDIIAQDGTKTTHYGEAKPLLLTDEQKALWDEFVSLTKRMEEAGAKLVFDKECDKMRCVNNDGLECIAYDEEEIDDETAFRLPTGYEELPHIDMTCLGYESVFVVKKLNK